ncbi:MAG: Peptidase C39 family protein [Microgenomates bacterium OLB23]|nr:MAG: Peptidase C39 family protein [Microgenomates bacterium OLB23]
MKPYKQTSSQSCLSVCLLTCINQDINVEKELELLYEGLKTTDPYSISVVRAFAKKYGKKATVYVDNNYYRKELHEKYASKNISFTYERVDVKLLEKLEVPYIVYLNTNTLLGTWDYSPHFVVVESVTDKFFNIIEPAAGKRMKVSKKKLFESIAVLKDRVHYCPLAIKVVE